MGVSDTTQLIYDCEQTEDADNAYFLGLVVSSGCDMKEVAGRYCRALRDYSA